MASHLFKGIEILGKGSSLWLPCIFPIVQKLPEYKIEDFFEFFIVGYMENVDEVQSSGTQGCQSSGVCSFEENLKMWTCIKKRISIEDDCP